MASLKTNVLLNLLNTFVNIAIPVVTFPYAARVLQLEGLGLANFLGSVVNYIVLITGLGIPMYAVKEVARHRDNIEERNHCTIEIAVLSFLLCLVGYVVVAVLCIAVPRISAHTDLFLILSLTIVFTAIGVNWFYQAIEDFKFITVRAIFFRILAAVCLFVFVHSPDDLLMYCCCMVLLAVGNNIINFVHLRKFISLWQIKWAKLNIRQHIRPTLQVFLPNLITSIYGNLNIVMIGFMQDDAAVGIYSAGNKLVLIVLTVITSLSVVLLPRCSNLVASGKMDDFGVISLKTIHLIFASALPCMAGMMLLSEPLVVLFCGETFAPASAVVMWTAPVLLLIGLSNVVGIQILYPLGKQNIVVWSMVVGILLNFVLNLLFIPFMSYMGTVWATLIAEVVVLFIQCYYGRKYIPFSYAQLRPAKYLAGSCLMAAVIVCFFSLFSENAVTALCAAAIGALVYGLTLFVLKDVLLLEFMTYVRQLFRRA